MARTTALISLLGAALAFGAAFATLALMGLGVPVLLAAVLAGAAAGLVLHAALLARVARPAAALEARLHEAETACAGTAASAAQATARAADIEARAATLRHDLRGVLSPALMVTDRLLSNADPAIQRAGQAIVRSVDRATAIIQASKPEPAVPAGPPGPAAG